MSSTDTTPSSARSRTLQACNAASRGLRGRRRMCAMRTGVSVALAVLASLVLATTSLAVVGWGPRESISPKNTCSSIVATVDNEGAAHAVALCDDDIVAFDRTGTTWTTRSV